MKKPKVVLIDHNQMRKIIEAAFQDRSKKQGVAWVDCIARREMFVVKWYKKTTDK